MLEDERRIKRRCGECTLCCKLLPVKDLNKSSNTRCQYQRTGKGCAVYQTDKMPLCCKLWSCLWLEMPDKTAGMRRPDRCRYVIDVIPDYVTMTNNETGEVMEVPVVQVWVDPKRPDAYKDKALYNFLNKAGENGFAGLMRYSHNSGFLLLPPSLTGAEDFIENKESVIAGDEHTAADIMSRVNKDML